MKGTEEILKEQIQNAMEDGKYRILLHRTYTDGLGLNEEGITRDICIRGLKIFGDTNIEFSTSDYKNDIEQIMHEIKVAHTYKASDKIFILKVPTNALEYTPGNSTPILFPTDEFNQYGNQCYRVCPQYMLGYVENLSGKVSTLQYNTLMKQEIGTENLKYTSSIIRQYREQRESDLQGIRTDRYYTDAEKKQLLQILYARTIKNGQISKKLQRRITTLMPEVDLKSWGLATSNNLAYHHLVERFLREHKGKKITVKMLEEEFSKTRPMVSKEIVKAIPALINNENIANSTLSQEEIIYNVAEANGFDSYKMSIVNQHKKRFSERIKDLFGGPKQKLLEVPKCEKRTAHQEFLKKYEFKPKDVLKAKKSNTIEKTIETEGRE